MIYATTTEGNGLVGLMKQWNRKTTLSQSDVYIFDVGIMQQA